MRLNDLLTGLGYFDNTNRRHPYDEFAFSVFTCALDDLAKGDSSMGVIVPTPGRCPVRGHRFIFRPHQGPLSIVFWVQPEFGVVTCTWVKPALIPMIEWKPQLDISRLDPVKASVETAREICGLNATCLSEPISLGLLVNTTRSVGTISRRIFCLELRGGLWQPYDGGLVPWMKEGLHPEMWAMPGVGAPARENDALGAIAQTLSGRDDTALAIELKPELSSIRTDSRGRILIPTTDIRTLRVEVAPEAPDVG